MTVPVLVTLALRICLVILFLPFSALDKTLNFNGAVQQAKQVAASDTLAKALILVGLGVEIFMSLGVITGVADRAAAFVLGGYCAVTALLFKQFWTPGDFWHKGDSKARNLFWDFLKNFSLAAGILLITFGTIAPDVPSFFASPFSSTHPYRQISP
jgi:putative oxidoreductase